MESGHKNSRLAEALVEAADDMAELGLLSPDEHRKITLRHGGAKPADDVIELSGEDIRAMREKANMSQAVFARHLHLTTGYVSQLERGAKKPKGPALVLLNLIRRRGIDAIT
ncbi:helix-turn-helix domain-containing protein [Rhizobium sp. C4]|uniref:helix-turn-helix domain-containing protein n=1 Tax=Rhizobium sp. C4 TaxID=1349800 RepID=UPI001E2F32E0|nr:helix-turn-helix domain-containing protein [Rhizobium sp. C4]MCD2172032.1 helix-turn-helix domain-containing protein [Rhizobium sp. C4]